MGVKIGRVLESKNGNFYIKIGAPTDKNGKVVDLKDKNGNSLVMGEEITLKQGDTIFLSNPLDEVDGLVERGHLSAEAAEARKAKIPSFIKYNLELNTNTGE